MQTVTPYLLYDDAAAAIEFLQRALGSEEMTRIQDANGRISHAELRLGGGEVHLGQPGEPTSPRRLGGTPVLSTWSWTTSTPTLGARPLGGSGNH